VYDVWVAQMLFFLELFRQQEVQVECGPDAMRITCRCCGRRLSHFLEDSF